MILGEYFCDLNVSYVPESCCCHSFPGHPWQFFPSVGQAAQKSDTAPDFWWVAYAGGWFFFFFFSPPMTQIVFSGLFWVLFWVIGDLVGLVFIVTHDINSSALFNSPNVHGAVRRGHKAPQCRKPLMMFLFLRLSSKIPMKDLCLVGLTAKRTQEFMGLWNLHPSIYSFSVQLSRHAGVPELWTRARVHPGRVTSQLQGTYTQK